MSKHREYEMTPEEMKAIKDAATSTSSHIDTTDLYKEMAKLKEELEKSSAEHFTYTGTATSASTDWLKDWTAEWPGTFKGTFVEEEEEELEITVEETIANSDMRDEKALLELQKSLLLQLAAEVFKHTKFVEEESKTSAHTTLKLSIKIIKEK